MSGDFDKRAAASLPGLLGLEFTDTRPGFIRGRMDIKPHHLAPNGYLHAASVIALADSACGRGCMASLPEGGIGVRDSKDTEGPVLRFTPDEWKAFVGGVRNGEFDRFGAV